ncbi:MAG: aminotransferase class I/II-fold pyridoxal phosphate-dependent enzyme [Verrucomicrobiales bacterium]|nr:aminotransferase class I/II-fold pyridoxal phosphate-dependent enzyme [Verrucomicrobiales bacterium]
MPDSDAYAKSLLHFVKVKGVSLRERSLPHWDWVEERRRERVWPYEKALLGRVGGTVNGADEFFEKCGEFVNFSSQDYLGLAGRAEMQESVVEAMRQYGVHSAGSPVLTGRNPLMASLEDKLCDRLGTEACVIFPTGWAAGFGVLAGLVREDDTVVLDSLSHNCLQEGARHATRTVRKFPHNDELALREILKEERNKNGKGGLFVVIESLYSMDSDSPDLKQMLAIARENEAIVIIDIAHDFGSMGKQGLGLLESLDLGGDRPDAIVGSFSKTFGTNGGFIACDRIVRQYLAAYSPPHIFSNAISPMQSAVALRAMDLAFSSEGDRLREQLHGNVLKLRNLFERSGAVVSGIPSPIVPVFVGEETLARRVSREIFNRGLLANLVEFPAVPRGRARFRFQVMATHGPQEIEQAAGIMQASTEAAA